MCSERDSPLEPFVLPAPGQPELARLTCGAHLGPPVLTRKQKRPRVNSLVCDRAAAFCAAGPPEALFWMSHLVTQAAKHERELARAHSQRLKQATLSLPGESVLRGFADRGALEGYPSHYTSLVQANNNEISFCDSIAPVSEGVDCGNCPQCHGTVYIGPLMVGEGNKWLLKAIVILTRNCWWKTCPITKRQSDV